MTLISILIVSLSKIAYLNIYLTIAVFVLALNK